MILKPRPSHILLQFSWTLLLHFEATDDSKNIQNNILFTKIVAKNLENHIQKAGAILEVTSKLPQVRNMSLC